MLWQLKFKSATFRPFEKERIKPADERSLGINATGDAI